MSLDEFNGVRSTIVDRGTPPASIAVSRESTFIFGTASRGPLHTPIRPTPENVREIFGPVPTGGMAFDTSLVRGYYEYVNSCAGKPDVALVRIGDVKKASIDLYEYTGYLSGDLSYTLKDGKPAKSLRIEAIPDGAEYNSVRVTVSANDAGEPCHFKIELPDGTSVGWNLSLNVNAPGVVTKVSQLARLINTDSRLSDVLVASYVPLEKQITLTPTYLSGYVSGSVVNDTYDLTGIGPNESWGDKLVGIREAYQVKEASQIIGAGELTAKLKIAPTKSLEESAPATIDQFIRVSNLETVLTVTPLQAGQANVTADLYCKKVNGWDPSYNIGGNTTHGWSFKLFVRRNGSTNLVELQKDVHYSLNASNGTVTILETLNIGDVYFASYRYKVGYIEAKFRSELLSGDPRSYFISGHDIIFGAEQPSDVYVYYTTKVPFAQGSVVIADYNRAIIKFTDGSQLPDPSIPVYLTILYEPELPAVTGTVLPGGVVQPGSLSGGSNGIPTTRKELERAFIEALKAVDLYPRRNNVFMGMYLDDTEMGYNYETGAPERVACNIFASVLPYIDRTSNLTNECVVEIPVRPPASLTQQAINEWIARLTENSDTDPTRPANLIDSINNFRAEAPVGAFITSIPEVNGGQRYFMNPACLYAAYKQNLPYDKSATHDFVPGNVLDLGVKIFNAEVIGKLNLKRYTAAIVDYGGRFIWADAPTLAIKGRSQFDRQFVRDTVYLAVGMAREVAQKYIGKPRLPMYLVAMKKDVSKALQMLVPNALMDLYVDVVPVQDGHITGKTKLRLMLVTAKEIRQIDIETSIELAA